MAKKKNNFYPYIIDNKETGIALSWDDCKYKISKRKARYKGFPTRLEAETWLDNGGLYEKKIAPVLEKGIYFDAGTGRGIGVEVRVTDEKKENLIDRILSSKDINTWGNYLCDDGKTNNFGELLGLYIALTLALKEGQKKIFGDSKLVINYWSKGRINIDDKDTLKLVSLVVSLREKYEKLGGTLSYVSGDYNPADLGFHK